MDVKHGRWEERRLRVCVNRILRRVFGSKRDEVTREWRKLHIEELHDMYSSPNIIWVIKIRRMRCDRHIAYMGREEVHAGFWWGNLMKRDHLEDPRVDGKIILMDLREAGCWGMNWIDLAPWTGMIWLRIGTSGGQL